MFNIIALILFTTTVPVPESEPVSDNQINEITREINTEPLDIPSPARAAPISIDIDSPLDMNWGAMLIVNGNGGIPPAEQITLPFMQKYPIDNLNIHINAIDIKF